MTSHSRNRDRSRRRGHTNGTGTTSLAELMARVAAGDHHAFTTLYNHTAGPVFGLILRLLRDPAQSEEVTQEVMIELWRTATRYRPDKGSPMTWIMTLAHRRAVDRIRSEQATTNREITNATRTATPPYDDVTETVERHLETEQIRRCLHTLTKLQHQAITLAYYHGYTYREVATTLHTPLGTIKTRLRDGLIRLRDCMTTNT